MMHVALQSTARNVRHQFEMNEINTAILKKLYRSYAVVPDIDSFISEAISIFPKLNCGVASVYLQHVLKRGTIVNGSFNGQNHTFLRSDSNIIIDITADQYGGPDVFVGEMREPWSLKQCKTR